MSEMSSPELRDPLDPADAARPTLAARLAERSRLRAQRAERLARLRPPRRAEAGPADDAAELALQEFLRALTGEASLAAPAAGAAAVEAAAMDVAAMDVAATDVAAMDVAAVLSFQRPERPGVWLPGSAVAPAPAAIEPSSVSDLERLPGVGPNLVWALEQAGIGCLADLVPLAPEELVDRLGPIGRLVPAAGWIAAARAAQPAG